MTTRVAGPFEAVKATRVPVLTSISHEPSLQAATFRPSATVVDGAGLLENIEWNDDDSGSVTGGEPGGSAGHPATAGNSSTPASRCLMVPPTDHNEPVKAAGARLRAAGTGTSPRAVPRG
ncbi:hypothetical protein [Amycolatopsis sulphurea]|uniref:hypothetical protein n=1 Tax=Amycolatopsis sulphurea TaxID=76022 RepID=UPI0011460549|nr:hypothetical protein [Amycolatopsis sulphurea]